MDKKQTFWADAQLCEKLSTIPKNEKSTVIRMALRDYFGLTDSRKGILGYRKDERGVLDAKTTERSRGSQGPT